MRILNLVLAALLAMSFSTNSFSQEAETKSLLSVLNSISDTKEKVDTLTTWAFKLAGGDDSLALSFARQGAQLAEAIGYQNGIADGFRAKGQVYYYGGKLSEAKKEFEKAKIVYKNIGDKEKTVSTLNNLGAVFTDLGDLSEASDCFNNAIQIAKELKDTIRLSACYANIASIFQRQGKIGKAIQEYEKLLKLDSLSKQFGAYAEDLGNLAICYLLA